VTNLKPNIWLLQAQSDIPGLIKALGSDDADTRKRASIALRTLGATNAIPTLQVTLAQEKDAAARIVIADALEYLLREDDGKTTHEKIIQAIIQLASDDPDQIIAAAHTLGELNDKSAAEPLVLLFMNAKMPGKVRLAAAEALIKLDSAPMIVTLLVALRSGEWRTRRNAAAMLGQLRADWAVEPLKAALKDENEVVVKTAQAALRRINGPQTDEETAGQPQPVPAPAPPTPTPEPRSPEVLKPVGDSTSSTPSAAVTSAANAAPILPHEPLPEQTTKSAEETPQPDSPTPLASPPQNEPLPLPVNTEVAAPVPPPPPKPEQPSTLPEAAPETNTPKP